ncbi:hypothetical protein NEFER03_0542 [Nematocida sp. LUAm3]|nr:hypothetical protein NEFER03_0542 [Nematocida sp. LUAm3]
MQKAFDQHSKQPTFHKADFFKKTVFVFWITTLFLFPTTNCLEKKFQMYSEADNESIYNCIGWINPIFLNIFKLCFKDLAMEIMKHGISPKLSPPPSFDFLTSEYLSLSTPDIMNVMIDAIKASKKDLLLQQEEIRELVVLCTLAHLKDICLDARNKNPESIQKIIGQTLLDLINCTFMKSADKYLQDTNFTETRYINMLVFFCALYPERYTTKEDFERMQEALYANLAKWIAKQSYSSSCATPYLLNEFYYYLVVEKIENQTTSHSIQKVAKHLSENTFFRPNVEMQNALSFFIWKDFLMDLNLSCIQHGVQFEEPTQEVSNVQNPEKKHKIIYASFLNPLKMKIVSSRLKSTIKTLDSLEIRYSASDKNIDKVISRFIKTYVSTETKIVYVSQKKNPQKEANKIFVFLQWIAKRTIGKKIIRIAIIVGALVLLFVLIVSKRSRCPNAI